MYTLGSVSRGICSSFITIRVDSRERQTFVFVVDISILVFFCLADLPDCAISQQLATHLLWFYWRSQAAC